MQPTKKIRRPSAPCAGCGNKLVLFDDLVRAQARTQRRGFRASAERQPNLKQRSERAAAGYEVQVIDRESQQLDGLGGVGNFGNGIQFNGFDVHGWSLSFVPQVIGV